MREVAATTCYAIDFNRPAPPRVEVQVVGRIPRIAGRLAFAHHIDAQIRARVYDDMADAARKLGLSRGRLTQLSNLTLLAPAIQDEILALPPITRGRDPINERVLRPIVAEPVWGRQLAVWNNLRGRIAPQVP